MDLALGRSLAGRAGTLSLIPELPSTLPGWGGSGRSAPGAGGVSRGLAKSRQTRLGRVSYRRDLCGREKGGAAVGKTKCGKSTKLMAVADGAGFPIALSVGSASPHEVRLVEDTLDQRLVDEQPERLIGDRAYDSDPLDEKLAERGIQLIAPHKRNRKKPKTQDGRALRRYRRRWKVERLFAWLQNYRRILVRYDRFLENYLAFVHLACILILIRNYF